MTNATAQMIAALTAEFAELDAEFVANSQEWIKERTLAVRAYKASPEFSDRTISVSVRYNKAFNIAGGKTWYAVIYGNSDAAIETFMAKNCARIIAKRNATITAKLEKVGATEVTAKDFARTKDGFNGVYTVLTDAGKKTVTINTIYAGGYNIQCWHQRTLIKVK